MTYHIRRAKPVDAPHLTQLAHRAKRHWGYPEQWMAEWRDVLTITGATISSQVVHVAESANDIVGFSALASHAQQWSLEHLWVDPPAIGKRVGRSLFEHAVRYVERHGGRTIHIEADPNAEGFYRHMGAIRIGDTPAPVAGTDRLLPLLEFTICAGLHDCL